MADEGIRPDRLSMEGMIWNANHVLEQALDPKQKGVPKDLFNKCIGICMVSVVEVGFMFSGNVGSGIVLRKTADGGWSPPSAVGLGGMGWGFLVGGAVKDIMIFIFDENSMDGMLGEAGIKIGGQINLTLGPFGRNYAGDIGISNKGASGTFSVAFSKGAFLSLSIEGAVVSAREGVNDNFYGKTTRPQEIVNGEVTLPEDKPTLIDKVYEKLAKLAEGNVHEPTEEETLANQVAAKVAQEKSEQLAQADPSGVMKVNAAEEAEKEKVAESKES